MAEPTYSDLDKGKTYDIQVFDGIPGRIGKVLEKEKGKKGEPGSVLIEFTRSPVYLDKGGIERKQDPKYTVWCMGDYHIYSYRELTGDMIASRTEVDKTPTPADVE